MKKFLKIFGLLGISILYFFVISYNSGHAYASNSYFSKSGHSKTDNYYSVVSTNLFCHPAQTESPVSISSSPTFTSVAQLFSVYTKAAEQVFFFKFSQYRFYALHVLIRFVRTDIIFPFHYFW